MSDAITNFLGSTGIAHMFSAESETAWWQYLIMYVIIGALFYLAIAKKFEPLLLLPIAFGMLLANLPGAELMHLEFFFDEYYITVENGQLAGTLAPHMADFLHALGENGLGSIYTLAEDSLIFDITNLSEESISTFNSLFEYYLGEVAYINNGDIHIHMSHIIREVVNNGGLVDVLYLGVKLGIYPSLIFMGVGAMTDFSPLIANPKSLLMGAGAQIGVFVAFLFALLLGFSPAEAGAIGIIGGADGPTAILVTKELAPHLLGAIAIAAYSYMALIPIIQPPFMKLLTTERSARLR